MRKPLFFLFLLALSFLPLTGAQTTYVQPMYETHWTTSTLLVSIPDTPADAKTVVLQAIDIWNKAQTWFVKSYEPNRPEDIITLEQAQSSQTAQVTITYVSSLTNGWSGETTQYGTRIFMVLNYVNIVLAAHELGHALGLGDNSIAGDLERSNYVFFPYPSTLDLYGVFLQAKCQCYTQDDTVTLPANISYFEWNPSLAVPEFPNSLPVLILAITSLAFAARLRKKKRT